MMHENFDDKWTDDKEVRELREKYFSKVGVGGNSKFYYSENLCDHSY